MAAGNDQAALVTGAAKRIGRALALDLAAHGWNVAVHYHRSAAEAHAVVAQAAAYGAQAVALGADLAQEREAASLVDRAAHALGPITLLINNASVFEFDRPQTADSGKWQRHLAINLRAPLVLTQALLAQLPSGALANVINLIDARVWNLTPNYTSYTVSKAGLWALTQHLALALAPQVRVNAIGPGLVLPPPRMAADDFAAMTRAMPLARAAAADEICGAVRFILSTPSLTGQMVALDSGQHLGWLHPQQTTRAE